MKYLKSFNESVDKSNIEEIKQTIREILLPISDMGYEIIVTDDATHIRQVGVYLLSLFRSVSYLTYVKIRILFQLIKN